jgi:DeoR family glycerol-3-phosphate regulon repressor
MSLPMSSRPTRAKLSVSERRQHIVNSIERFGAASVGSLAEACGVTSQTIRRDLQQLESEGVIQKRHGAAFAGPGSVVLAYKDRQNQQADVKRRLTARVGEFILPGSTIFVGLGTTFNSIHEVLKDRPRIVLATNNLGVAYSCTFNTGVTLFVFGGYLRRNDTAILAATGGGLCDRFKFDVAILGASAIDEDGAILAYDPLEVEFTQQVIRASRQVIFVVQAEKFGGRAPHVVAHLPQACVLITNCDPRTRLTDPSILDGTRVIVVDPASP